MLSELRLINNQSIIRKDGFSEKDAYYSKQKKFYGMFQKCINLATNNQQIKHPKSSTNRTDEF